MAALSNKRAWLILTVLAILAGTAWRAARLDNRPLHADEAVQAWQTWNLLEGRGYQYDPLDRHGPTLYYGSAALHRLSGGTAADYDDRAARKFSLAAGIATLVLLGFGARTVGFPLATGAFAVAALAFEPLSSLYHTYFVQEASLAFLLWAFLFLLLHQSSPRSTSHWIMLGVLAGLAQATKETTPLYLLLALLSVRLAKPEAIIRPRGRNIVMLTIGFLVPFVLFYSSFGANLTGLIDAFRTYVLQTQRVSNDAHAFPFGHYLKILGIGGQGPINWCAWGFLLLGSVGAKIALTREANSAAKTTAIFTLSLFIIHSFIPYKTPWLMLTPVIGWALLAGYSLSKLSEFRRWGWIAAVGLMVVTGLQSARISAFALDRYPGDARNLYFYQQAPKSILRLPERIVRLQNAQSQPLNVAIISPEHAWPLPWYLRHHPNVGYFDTAPANLADWPVVIWDDQQGESPAALEQFAIAEFYGLRPNVMLYTFIDGPTWEAAFPPEPTVEP